MTTGSSWLDDAPSAPPPDNDVPPGFTPAQADEVPPGFQPISASPTAAGDSSWLDRAPDAPAPPAPAAPLDPAETERVGRFLAWRSSASGLTPDRAAEALKYAAATGGDPQWVADNLDAVKKEVDASQVPWQQLWDQHPALRPLLGDPVTAQVIKDESTRLPDLLKWLTGGWIDDSGKLTSPLAGGHYVPPATWSSFWNVGVGEMALSSKRAVSVEELAAVAQHQLAELEIRGYVALGHWDPGERIQGKDAKNEPILQAAEVAATIIEALGARAILITVSSMGGHIPAALAVYAAIRAFQEGGGRVVVYVEKGAYSSAAIFILAADFVVIDPDAVLWPHGMVAVGGEAGGELFSFLSNAVATILAAQTLLNAAEVEACVAPSSAKEPGGIQFYAERAVEAGYADFIGGHQEALDLVEQLAASMPVESPRQKALAEREGTPELLLAERAIERVTAAALQLALFEGVESLGSCTAALGDWVGGKFVNLVHGTDHPVPKASIRNAPALAFLQESANRLSSAVQAWDEGDEQAGEMALHAAELMIGIPVGTPVRQVDRTAKATKNLITGETTPAGPLEAAGNLIYGEGDQANPLKDLQKLLNE